MEYGMAVLNVRVDDYVRDQLKGMADDEGVTLSEYIRDLLLEAVVPVRGPDPRHGDEPAPETLRATDRLVLSLLHRILGRVLPEDVNDVEGDLEDQLERAEILEAGYAGEYWREVAGLETELSRQDCERVSDILQMFRIVTFSIRQLHQEGQPLEVKLVGQLEFRGFDHNDSLEGHMARYVKYQMRDDCWEELKPQVDANDNGNSHMQVLDLYIRMLAEYRRIMDARGRGSNRYDYLLSREELQQIAEAQVHPSHRRPIE